MSEPQKVTDSELVDRLRDIVRHSDSRTTTASAVRRRLEEELAVDLYGRRAFITQQIDSFLRNEDLEEAGGNGGREELGENQNAGNEDEIGVGQRSSYINRMSVHAGPDDAVVLYQQQTHISSFITPNNLDNTLRVRRSDNLIWELWRSGILHDRVRSCLNEIGFYGILCCGNCVYDNHLITALVERWRRETHTFHLRVGEATITLQDVALIWGLNVDGHPIIGTDVSYKFSLWQGYCNELLGFVPLQTDFRGNSMKLTTLYSNCTQTVVDGNSTDIEVAQYSRCVALLIIGGCMFPDSEGCAVKLLYLHFLQDMHKVRSYSWASAVLAYLYHELCSASGSGKHEIAGPLYILQIWAWSRMTPLCPDRFGYNLIAPPENPIVVDNILPIPPYGARWKHSFTWTHTPTHSVRIIRDVLDNMRDGQFKWIVYDPEAVDVLSLPLECRHPNLWRSECPLICFHIVEMHRPNRVLRQFGMSQNIPIPALDGDQLHESSRRGRKNYDWVKHHRVLVDSWENRHNLIVETEMIEDFSMGYDYGTWYDSITRRFISPIEPQQMDYGYQSGDAYFRRVVRDQASILRNLFKGLSVDDQPREALAEVVKKTIQIGDLLYEMSLRTPEQQHHHTRSTRRRHRNDDVDDEPSFSTPEWGQSTSTQSSPTTLLPHTSYDVSAHGMTTQSLVTLVGSSIVHGTSHMQNSFQTPQHDYEPCFTELLFEGQRHQNEEFRPNFNISPISYMRYSHPQSSIQVPPNVDIIVGSNVVVNINEEEDFEAPQLVRKNKRVPKSRDCGT